MRLAVGIILMWTGAACLWLSRSPLQDGSPWGAYRTLLERLNSGTSSQA